MTSPTLVAALFTALMNFESSQCSSLPLLFAIIYTSLIA
ncbi:hypothetical protein [Aeromonas phage Akh-2]|nr:hypothetical protein [Aeromonas phage Akh-2]